MRKITPSQALTKMQGFIDRVDRIKENDYSHKRFLTYDLNRLKREYRDVSYWYSISIFNKNQERAKSVIKKCKSAHKKAYDILNNLYS